MPESTGTDGQASADHGTAARPSRAALHPHHGPGPLAAIGVGGALGTLARYVCERVVVADPAGIPWATLSVNVIGSFVLGVVVTLVSERWPGDRFLRPLVAVGFCGGFTTFSTFAVEVDQRVRHGHAGSASAYLAASLLAGIGAALAGITLARGRVLPAPGGLGPVDPDLLAGDDPGEDAPRGAGPGDAP